MSGAAVRDELAALAAMLRDDHVEMTALVTTLIGKGSFTEVEWREALGRARGLRFCR